MPNLNIMYIHGFGSRFDPNSSKVKHLEKLGCISGISYDYTEVPDVNIPLFLEFITENKIDIVVGTSLGGWYASKIGHGIPYVALNPSIRPSISLMRYVGEEAYDHWGTPYHLSSTFPEKFEDFTGDGCGIVMINKGDDDIPHTEIDEIETKIKIFKFDGGDHRFTNIESALPIIDGFCGQMLSYGA